jgi:hypothetical protein
MLGISDQSLMILGVVFGSLTVRKGNLQREAIVINIKPIRNKVFILFACLSQTAYFNNYFL